MRCATRKADESISRSSPRDDRHLVVAHVVDRGPGIRGLDDILAGRGREQGPASGLVVSKRLSDCFEVDTAPGQTRVTIGKRLPRRATVSAAQLLQRLSTTARASRPTPTEELQQQNRELFAALQELSDRKAEIERLNSELNETNRGVLALYAELEDQAESLRRASALKSRFLSDMSHELRTPLNAMISLSGLLLARTDGQLSDEQERQVQLIRSSSESLLEMVNGLLDLAKIEAGRTELRYSHFDLGDVLSALRGMFRPLIGANVALRIDDPRVPIAMHCDEARLLQIVRNLVANALKFTEQGEVHVTAELGEGATLRLRVRDSGIGIAPDDVERIFDDFTQVDGPVQRRVQGTGLGLPLARKLAGLLGGTLTVESEPGRGSTFTVVIPLDCSNSDSSSDGGLSVLGTAQRERAACLNHRRWRLRDPARSSCTSMTTTRTDMQ